MSPLVAPTVWLLDSRPIFLAHIQHPERLGPASPPRTLIISLYSSAPTICPTWLVYPWPFLPDTASSRLCLGDAVHLAGPKATALAGIPHWGPAHREHPPPHPWHFLPLSRSQGSQARPLLRFLPCVQWLEATVGRGLCFPPTCPSEVPRSTREAAGMTMGTGGYVSARRTLQEWFSVSGLWSG